MHKISYESRAWAYALIMGYLTALVSCSADEQPVTQWDLDLLAALYPVLVLYNDSAPGLQTASAHAPLKPGLASLEGFTGVPAQGEALRTQSFSYTDAGKVYATMLVNLLGRYNDLNVRVVPVSAYTPGAALDTLRTFYIGSTYEDPVPDALITDVMNGAPVTWINYRIWRLDRPEIGASLSQLGLRYVQLHSAWTPELYGKTFDSVDYRGYTFKKYPAPMEMVELAVEGESVVVHAWSQDAAGKRIPYALQSGNFWYVADLPLAHIHETDRYLVFADLLAPMLNKDETCAPRAVARMEDLSPNDSAGDLRRMLNSIRRVNIPFAAAVIPVYADNDQNVRKAWTDNPDALKQLRRVANIKGRYFQHGYTHQYEAFNKPSGVSGNDWEFWDVSANGPIAGMTAESAVGRVEDGRAVLERLGVKPLGWVTPHYAFEPSYGRAFNAVYPRAFERRLYRSGDLVAGQFYPYPVRDSYGTLMVPEDAGSVQPYLILDVLEAARQPGVALSLGGAFLPRLHAQPAV